MRALLCGLAALAFLSACQDPSTVGTGLIDEDVPNPNVRVLAATSIDSTRFTPPTAGFTVTSDGVPQSRVLIGEVRDALYGDAAARAYVDARSPNLPSGFAERPVTSVALELRRSYVYGDTTASVPLELRQVSTTWNAAGLPADTTLPTGDLLATASLSAADTLVVLPLPEAWVQANGAVFARDAPAFLNDFEGFEVRTPGVEGRGAVLGFDVVSPRSRIRVTTSRDTVSFPISELLTSLRLGPPGLAPMGRRLLRGGTGVGVRFAFDYSAVLRLPLSQAVFRLPLDRSLAGTEGPFKRPIAASPALFVLPETGDPLFASPLATGATGDARSVTNAAAPLNALVQSILLEQAVYRGFEVRLQSNPLSLDVLPIVTDAPVPTQRPRLSLTVVGA